MITPIVAVWTETDKQNKACDVDSESYSLMELARGKAGGIVVKQCTPTISPTDPLLTELTKGFKPYADTLCEVPATDTAYTMHVDVNENWLISKIYTDPVTKIKDYQYVLGNGNIPTNWTNRASQTYNPYHNIA